MQGGASSPTQEQHQPHDLQLKLTKFLDWLKFNGIQLCGCSIKLSKEGSKKGYGVYAINSCVQGILMVTPLRMAITPMSVLQDPVLGQHYQRLFDDSEVDDRLLIMLFLLVERLRGISSFWAPYVDMLPVTFGTPLWCSEEELSELKGTSLFHATTLQHKSLRALFQEKIKPLVESFLYFTGCHERDFTYRDFLWANCLFWSRALNIPCPHTFVFPSCLPTPPALHFEEEKGLHTCSPKKTNHSEPCQPQRESREVLCETQSFLGFADQKEIPMNVVCNLENQEYNIVDMGPQHGPHSERNCEILGDANSAEAAGLTKESTIWVEGLVPGIDFCNHEPRSLALWEVDGEYGSVTEMPFSMYLTSAPGAVFDENEEIHISYGNKGNEELLFLYGFTIDNNPDDYLMLHLKKEVLEQDQCFEVKIQLLGDQKLPLRWLLPASLLEKEHSRDSNDAPCKEEPENKRDNISFSWSGQRIATRTLESIAFPEDLMATMRVVAMSNEEVATVLTLLEQLSYEPSVADIRAAVWEVCGDCGAFKLLISLLSTKMKEMEDGTGTEEFDAEILKRDHLARMELVTEDTKSCMLSTDQVADAERFLLSDFKRNCVVYRKGQKRLVQEFLKEAEQGLKYCSG